MEKLKKILHRLLFPGAAVVILSVPVGADLLLYTVGRRIEGDVDGGLFFR